MRVSSEGHPQMKHVDLPALLIGLTVAFYWGRVLKLVFKARRTTGKTANFLPPEPLGRLLRVGWYPNVVAWIVIPLLTAFLWRPVPGFTYVYDFLAPRYAAVGVAWVALYLTLICWRKMGRAWRMGIDPAEKNTLIVSGPYAFVRHPIYALQQLLMIASVVAVPSFIMVLLGVFQLLFLQWEARREEAHMTRVHGDTYVNYLKQVGRFVPRGKYTPA